MEVIFMVIVLIIAVVVIGVGVTIYRLRPGGPGPAMNWMPKSMRKGANAEYDKHDWQKPFDDDGSRNADRDAL